jgi:hypothetical protein
MVDEFPTRKIYLNADEILLFSDNEQHYFACIDEAIYGDDDITVSLESTKRSTLFATTENQLGSTFHVDSIGI